MSRLIYVPQLPVLLRYSEWYYTEFPKQLSKQFEVIVLGDKYIFGKGNSLRKDLEMFSPIDEAIRFEQYQIDEYLNLKLEPEDILLSGDISFPGFFSNVLYHKRPSRCYAICHATSLNNMDYFEPVRQSKWLVESGHSLLFDKVFVATRYHFYKLNVWKNVVITSLPAHPYTTCFALEKAYDIVSVSRPTPQKVNPELEQAVTELIGPVIRKTFNTWDNYYEFLSKSKVLFISSSEETFGYQILDAVYHNCIPICPHNFSYPELLPEEYLYKDKNEAVCLVLKALKGQLKVPKLLCQEQIDNFFDTIKNEMTV
jgi:hypothetical protein